MPVPSISLRKGLVEYNVLKASEGKDPWSDSSTIYLGIDPGLSGGIAVIKQQTIEWFQMPKTEKDTWNLIRQFGEVPCRCIIEQIVPNLWGKGKSSVAKLYANYMALRMALTAAEIAFEDVTAGTWQKGIGIKRKKDEPRGQLKGRLRAKCQQFFPRISLWERTKGEQLAVCDAILIALYCQRQ